MTSRFALLAAPLVSAFLFCSAPISAQANDERSYVGLGLGQSTYGWRNNSTGGSDFCPVGATVINCEDSPTGYKVFLGYNFTPYLGGELSYYNAGKGSILLDDPGNSIRQLVILNGGAVSAVGTLPLGPAFVSARVGIAASTVSRKDNQAGARIYSADRTKASPIIGLGMGATVWRSLALRLDWDRVRAETAFNEKFEADLYTLNVMYRFE